MFKELLTVLGSLHTVALLFYCIWTTYRLWGFNVPSIGLLLQCVNCQGAMWTMLYYFYSVLYTVQCTVHCQDAIWFILSISTVYTVSRRHLNYCILSQFYSVWSVKASSELYFSISTVYTVSRRHLNYIVTFLQCIVSRRHLNYIVPYLHCTLSQGTVWIILSHFLQCTLSQGAILIILSHFYSVQCQGAMWIMVWRLALIE